MPGWSQPSTGCPGPPGEAQHPGEDTKAGVLALWGEVASLGNYRKALCSLQALQMDKLDDRRPAEMAARFGETPEPTVGLVGHSQVRQPAQENT